MGTHKAEARSQARAGSQVGGERWRSEEGKAWKQGWLAPRRPPRTRPGRLLRRQRQQRRPCARGSDPWRPRRRPGRGWRAALRRADRLHGPSPEEVGRAQRESFRQPRASRSSQAHARRVLLCALDEQRSCSMARGQSGEGRCNTSRGGPKRHLQGLLEVQLRLLALHRELNVLLPELDELQFLRRRGTEQTAVSAGNVGVMCVVPLCGRAAGSRVKAPARTFALSAALSLRNATPWPASSRHSCASDGSGGRLSKELQRDRVTGMTERSLRCDSSVPEEPRATPGIREPCVAPVQRERTERHVSRQFVPTSSDLNRQTDVSGG